jgi:hypothetical protein
MKPCRAFLTVTAFLALCPPGHADPAPIIYYAPNENLEHVDVVAQLADHDRSKVFQDLADTPGVEIRVKHKRVTPIHLKSYQIDIRMLPTGAANFSASGRKRQDNDLIERAEAAAAFKHNFEARFVSGEALAPSMGR